MFVVGFDGVLVQVNDAFAAHVGEASAELVGQRMTDFIHPDDVELASTRIAAVASGERTPSLEIRIMNRDGRVSWVVLSSVAVAARAQIFFSGVDVTSRHQTHKALLETEQRFNELAENISEVFWIADADLRRILYASPAFEPIWGRRLTELLQNRNIWHDAIHFDDRPRAELAFRHLIDEGDMDIEYRIMRPDGSMRWIHDRAYPVITPDGTVTRVAGIASDITDRKQAQLVLQAVALGTAAARTGDPFFQNLMRHVSTALSAHDAWLTEPGEEPSQLRVLAWWSNGGPCKTSVLTDKMTPCHRAIENSPIWLSIGACRVFPHPMLNNREAYIATSLTDTSGRVLGVLSVAWREPLEDLEMTESILQIFAARAAAELERQRVEARARRREEELAHLDRLQTMGEMASGIAHELNQPLLAIMGHAAAARLGLPNDARNMVERDLSDIELQAERAATIIQRLRLFVQRHPPVWTEININTVVEDVLRLIALNVKQLHARVTADLDPTVPSTWADRLQLEQVLVNLISNALEATQTMPEEERVVVVRTETRVGELVVAVDDRGPGPAKELNPFEPFVSTKANGLGIGLSISRTIIERHQGHLWYEPNSPQGCRFAFRLPLEPPDVIAGRRT